MHRIAPFRPGGGATSRFFRSRRATMRFQSSKTEPTRSSSSSSNAASGKAPGADASAPISRIDRVISKVPRFLHPYVVPLRHAPLSHVTAFLLLHELTAVVPLFGLAGLFHYSGWLPAGWAEGSVAEGLAKLGRFARRKGWIGEEGMVEAERELQLQGEDAAGEEGGEGGRGGEGVRWLVEFATAYAVTKALLPARLVLSAWATPWFARVAVLPVTRLFRRLRGVKG